MSIAYKIVARKLKFDNESENKTVYSVRPASYGTLTTEDAARQITAESSSSPGDVKSVLDRYAYFVKENLRKGYSIELLDCGTLFTRFITGKSAETSKDANASLVKSMIPGFRPSYKLSASGSRVYNLIPTKISIVKFGDEVSTTTADDSSSDTGGSTSGSDTGSDTRSDSGTDTGSDDTGDGGFQG
jgi:predicted histone-like DNA-binding protein